MQLAPSASPSQSQREGPARLASHDWQSLLQRAVEVFSAHGTSLTPLRKAVIAELFAAHNPLGAYDLADRLGQRNGRRVAANSVYRVLTLCQAVGLVRRVESKHAYVVVHADEAGAGLFLLCDSCGGVTPVSDPQLDAVLAESSAAAGFHAAGRGVELAGTCRECDAATLGEPEPA